MSGLIDVAFSAMFSRWLAPRPSIRKVGNRLVVSSTWRTSLLSFGAVSRNVTLDAQDRLMRVTSRTCWAFTNVRWIKFQDVSEVVYDYRDLFSSDWISHTEQDLYTVGLWLKSNEVVPLFKFYGEGDYINNSIWPDWMRWDDFLAAEITRGTQDSDSRRLADVLSGLIGVPVGNGPA